MNFKEIAAEALDESVWQDGDDFDEAVFAEDAAPAGGGNLNKSLEFDLQKHDARFHGGHYDGKTECKYREKMAAAMGKAGMNPVEVNGLGTAGAGAVATASGQPQEGEPSEAEKKFMDLKARFEKEGQTEISKEEYEKAREEYFVAELGEAETECIRKLMEAARSDEEKGAKAEAAADRILNDPKSTTAQKEGAQAIKDARKEWKVGGKTYVDVSGMGFWEGMAEAFKAGFEGKEIVTDWDKTSGRWDAIVASDPNFKEENGLLQEGVKDALADLGFGEDFERAQKIEGLSREQWQEIGYLKYQFDQAESAKEKHAAWRELKKYLAEQGLEKEKKGGKNGVMEPITPNYTGPLAGDDLLDPETADTNDKKYGDDCAQKLEARLAALGVKASGKGEAHVGPSATVVEFPVDASYNMKKARAAMANLGAAIGANITSVGYAPGKADTLRIEFTNDKMRKVGFANIIKSKEWDEKKDKYAIPTAIGKSSSGEDIVHDDSKMPHEVVTGETGSGKSVYLQAKINSAQMAKTPEEYQQVLIDPKRQEFGNQTGSPFNMFPVQFTPEGASKVIAALRAQMEKRASMLGVNLDEYDETKNEYIEGSDANLQAYNARQTDKSKKLPFVKIYIDELAALTKDPTYGPQIEADLDQLMAKSRSIGFSFTLSSQRNDVASIKGSIAANAPSRMIFKAANDDAKASRAAKSLGGEGDFIHIDKNGKETRGRACYISDGEKERIAAFYRNGGKSAAKPAPKPAPQSGAGQDGGGDGGAAKPAPKPTQKVVIQPPKALPNGVTERKGKYFTVDGVNHQSVQRGDGDKVQVGYVGNDGTFVWMTGYVEEAPAEKVDDSFEATNEVFTKGNMAGCRVYKKKGGNTKWRYDKTSGKMTPVMQLKLPAAPTQKPAQTASGQQQGGGAANGAGSSTGNTAGAQNAGGAAQTQQTVKPGQTVTNLSQSQVKQAEALTKAQEDGVKAFLAAQPAKGNGQQTSRDNAMKDDGFAEEGEEG